MKPASTAVLAAVVVALAVPAEARPGWPRPAAGESHSGDPEVIFTFDDGPHERYSAMILDTLAKHGVSAIFYWVGHRVDDHRRDSKKRRRRRVLIQRAIDAGHLIGNHTVNHVHLCHQKVDAAAEIDQNHGLYERLAAFPIVLFRAPYGDRCRRLELQLGERGFTHLHWDIDPREYNGLTAEGTAEYVIGKLRGLRGRAVVLMHDTKGASARALPRILEWIDLENERRQKIGKRPIRILSGSDWLIQSQHGPLWSWGEETAGAARSMLGRAMGSLVPGAPESPVVADDAVPGAPSGPATSAGLAGEPPASASAGVAGGRADAPTPAGAATSGTVSSGAASAVSGSAKAASAGAAEKMGSRTAAGTGTGSGSGTGTGTGTSSAGAASAGAASAGAASAGAGAAGSAAAAIERAAPSAPSAPSATRAAGGAARPATTAVGGGQRPRVPAVSGAPARTHTSTLASP